MNTIAPATPRIFRPLRIVLPGGSGQVGQALARSLTERGHQVTVLTRGPYTAQWQTVHWDAEEIGPWTEYLEGADVCINLAGRSVNCRYDATNREAIYESRLRSTRLLGRVMAGLSQPPRVWMNASAATIYRRALDEDRVDLPVDETGELDGDEAPAERQPSGAKAHFHFVASTARLKSCPDASCYSGGIFPQAVKSCPDASCDSGGIFPQAVKSCPDTSSDSGGIFPQAVKSCPDTSSGSERWAERKGFSARVARDWEAAFFSAETPRTRKVALRSAVVLSPTAGSAFGVLSNLVRMGLGGTQGNGRQFVCWIHEADYARAVEFLVEHEEVEGPVNIAAPNPLSNRDFMAALRWAWDVPNGLPAPSLAIKLGAIFLRTEPELVLQSCRAVPGRLLEAGFRFEFPEWAEAAEDLVRQGKSRN
jgi:NAD dependent epimerase/dehydratase family enzyme